MKIVLRTLRVGMSPSARWIAATDGGVVSKVPWDFSWIDTDELASEPYGIGSTQKEAVGDLLLNSDFPGVYITIDSPFIADQENARRK